MQTFLSCDKSSILETKEIKAIGKNLLMNSQFLNSIELTDATMSNIIVSRKGDMKPGNPTQGLSREIALEGPDAVVIHSTTEGGTVSAWHHHAEHNTYGYLIPGALRFEFGPGGKQSVDINPGEYFYVPAGVIHRDVNPSKDSKQDAIIIRTGSGPTVINVDGPEH